MRIRLLGPFALVLAVTRPTFAQMANEMATESASAPYADRVTLRPLALPAGVLEADVGVVWTRAPRFDGEGLTSPIETLLGARVGVGPVQAHAGIAVHTRYATQTYRPRLIQHVELGADYRFSPMFTAGLELSTLHPFGDDIQQGLDVRADVAGKTIISPTWALVGAAGAAYQSRKTRGQELAADTLQLVGDGALQLAPMRRVTYEALATVRYNVRGNLYGDGVWLVDLGMRGTVNLTRRWDAYGDLAHVIVPLAADDLILTFGIKYRHP